MRQPEALKLSWAEFDCQTPEYREWLRDDMERYFAAMDLRCCKIHLGEAHPNEEYEYQPLIAVRMGNYR